MLAVDVVVRVAGASVWLLLAACLLRAPGHARAARWFLPLAFGLAGFLAGNTPHAQTLLPGVAGTVAGVFSGSAAVFLWWFCLALFDDGFRFRLPQAALATVWWPVMLLDRGLPPTRFASWDLSWLLVALALGMCAHLIVRLLRDREGDLVEARRRGRLWLVAALVALLLTDLLADIVMGLAWKPQAFALTQNLALFGIALYLAWGWLRIDPDAVTHQPARRSAAMPAGGVAPADDDPLLQRLDHLMIQARVYRDPGLTVAAFAAQMGAPEPEVRRLVNQRLGWRHFRSFINHHRIEDAKTRLADPACAQDKILAIALESGFASLPSFNRSFRDAEGIAPGEYRRRALAVDRAPPTSGTASQSASEHRSIGF